MSRVTVPKGFLWGAATSAHQVEGDNEANDWWAWERAGRVPQASGLACDHYRRFAADFDLAAELGHTAHRFSIEWSRIEPVKGRWNEPALLHYRDVVRALRDRGLEPIVTLHHYTNPQWVTDAGGWAKADVVDWFSRYVERVVKVLGKLVRYWVTINEPMVFVHMHFVEGTGPPGVKNLRTALRVTEHLIRAHAISYKLLHDNSPADPPIHVSIAKYLPVFVPCRRWSPFDRGAAHLTDRIFNRAFLDAVTEGRWSVPGLGRWTVGEARQTLDYLGINFYRRHFIRFGYAPQQWLGRTCELGHHAREVTEVTPMGWDVHPASFYFTLKRWSRLGLPMLVTENGTCLTDDARRWHFIASHLKALARAMRENVSIFGYLYWSLLDNFEWHHGFGPRFGLIDVDYGTQERRVRESARRYAALCRSGIIGDEAGSA